MQPWRLVDLAQACRIEVSREDWYRIYKAEAIGSHKAQSPSYSYLVQDGVCLFG